MGRFCATVAIGMGKTNAFQDNETRANRPDPPSSDQDKWCSRVHGRRQRESVLPSRESRSVFNIIEVQPVQQAMCKRGHKHSCHGKKRHARVQRMDAGE
jgi:hypothetical protein